MAYYVDTSALTKLVRPESETPALRAWVATVDESLVTSDLSRTELARAVRRASPERMTSARAVLDRLTITTLSTAIFESAARLEPTELRSLDALHLAAALDLGDDLTGLVAYDHRLLAAARAHGVQAFCPGQAMAD